MTRRTFSNGMLGVLWTTSGRVVRAWEAGASAGRMMVLAPRTAAYEDAISGILERLQAAGVQTSVVDARGESVAAEIEKAMAASPKVVIAGGSEAVDLAGAKCRVPMVSAMTMKAPTAPVTVAASVLLGVPAAAMLTRLKACFPGKSRIGIPFNPDGGEGRNALKAECTRAGFSVEISDCASAAELVPRLIELKDRKVNFVLCLADSTLYNAATIKPLVMASLEHRIPLIGFSASFVRAGAAVGIYADLKALGRQAAEAALRYVATRKSSEPEDPSMVQVAVNQRVLRLIGLDFREKDQAEVVVFR